MSTRRRVVGSVAGAIGLVAAGGAVSMLRQQRSISRRAGEDIAFGSLRSEPVTVVADDGVPLHVEIDDLQDNRVLGSRMLGRATAPDVTVVFVHGFCLNLDCWHFQRAAYRNLVRTVFYDQRSHGRSGNSDREHSTIDQLGSDLKAVIDATTDGPVVLVGHSMGGMAIVSLVEQHPELVGSKIIGAGLISTTAGGLDVGRILLPMLPARLSGGISSRAVRTLHRGHRAVDSARRLGRSIATVATDRYAFGGEVPKGYVEFVDEMLSATPFEVVADFFPLFTNLDKFHAVEALGAIPTSVICGTSDKITSIGHSRKLHSRIPDSGLLECDGAGHMVIFERHDLVNAELDQLITAATAGARSR
ncbi:alpha/beta hydrolase [Nocardioides humilatus]|uniref:Alpha/beta hydrolase n=1 Tax=Nocardioides humilatus TaxID=2607660 RepID=A0A5B1LLF1_9ACTN|nr:alpha/beta hydrolase [Nocardioides humilatus]KAA1421304.1 alpha/beta hydrolase [Nocardioides humilatus]